MRLLGMNMDRDNSFGRKRESGHSQADCVSELMVTTSQTPNKSGKYLYQADKSLCHEFIEKKKEVAQEGPYLNLTTSIVETEVLDIPYLRVE